MPFLFEEMKIKFKDKDLTPKFAKVWREPKRWALLSFRQG